MFPNDIPMKSHEITSISFRSMAKSPAAQAIFLRPSLWRSSSKEPLFVKRAGPASRDAVGQVDRSEIDSLKKELRVNKKKQNSSSSKVKSWSYILYKSCKTTKTPLNKIVLV